MATYISSLRDEYVEEERVFYQYHVPTGLAQWVLSITGPIPNGYQGLIIHTNDVGCRMACPSRAR